MQHVVAACDGLGPPAVARQVGLRDLEAIARIGDAPDRRADFPLAREIAQRSPY
jgi:hypothetical protein